MSDQGKRATQGKATDTGLGFSYLTVNELFVNHKRYKITDLGKPILKDGASIGWHQSPGYGSFEKGMQQN